MAFFFSHPAAAWFLPAIALPILFHLFFRLRRHVEQFPSLMFFLRIDPRLSAKRKIHEWLILLLRCLLIALILLALARPFTGLLNSDRGVARLLLLDNSGSMAAPAPGGMTKLKLATRAVERLIAEARPGDSIAVQLLIPDPLSTLPDGFDANPAALREGLEKLEPTDGAPSVPPALRKAFAALPGARQAAREIHIITDLQRGNWSRGELEAGESGLQGKIFIHHIPTPTATGGAVSLEIAEAPTRSIPAGRICPVKFTLLNRGPAQAHVRLNSTDDTGRNETRDISLNPGESQPATLTFSFPQPGFHWAQAWVEGDVAASATHAALGFWCSDVAKAVFVGTKEAFGALPYAVAPGGNPDLSGIEPDFIDPAQLIETLATNPLAVVVTWQAWPSPASAALEAYVRHGGMLFVLPAPDTGIAVSAPPADWLGISADPVQAPKEAEATLTLQPGDPLWRDLRDADGKPQLGLLRAFRYQPLKTGPDWQPLLVSGTGATLFARRNLDQGRIFASGVAFTPKWSSLPVKVGFVVLIQNAFFGTTSEQIPVQLTTAADDVRFDLPGESASVQSLAGAALSWQGTPHDFAGLDRAGVYELRQGTHVKWIATHGNTDETVADFLPAGPIPVFHNLSVTEAELAQDGDLLRVTNNPNAGWSLYGPILAVALALMMLETWLANERSSDLGRKLFGEMKTAAAPRRPHPSTVRA